MSVVREELEEALNFYDTVGDKKIGVDQVGLCLRAIGLVPTEALIKLLTSSFGEGSRLGVSEVMPMASEVARSTPKNVDLSLCLAPFDRDSTGTIAIAELRHVLMNCGDRLSDFETEQLLQGIDMTDGKVNIPFFVKHIQNTFTLGDV